MLLTIILARFFEDNSSNDKAYIQSLYSDRSFYMAARGYLIWFSAEPRFNNINIFENYNMNSINFCDNSQRIGRFYKNIKLK